MEATHETQIATFDGLMAIAQADADIRQAEQAEQKAHDPDPEPPRNKKLEAVINEIFGVTPPPIMGRVWEPAPGWEIENGGGYDRGLDVTCYVNGDPFSRRVKRPADLLLVFNEAQKKIETAAKLAQLEKRRPLAPTGVVVNFSRAEWYIRLSDYDSKIKITIGVDGMVNPLVIELGIDDAGALVTALAQASAHDEDDPRVKYQLAVMTRNGDLVTLGRDFSWGSSLAKIAVNDGAFRLGHWGTAEELARLGEAVKLFYGFLISNKEWRSELADLTGDSWYDF